MTEREMVEEFHRLVGAPVRERPEMPSAEERVMRCTLLLEEVLELIQASGCRVAVMETYRGWLKTAEVRSTHAPDLAAMAHENADIRYVSHGTDLAMGVDGGAVFELVNSANMRKIGPDGRVRRNEHGKILKPEQWEPADIASELRRQGRKNQD